MLDIGCGNRPKGDVNVDLYPESGHHRDIIAPIESIKKISNFVKADALNLPFRDKTFDTAFSHHCIEHVDNPIKFVQEMQRVGKRIILEAPMGCTNDWLFFRVHNHRWSLFPWWYRKMFPEFKTWIRLTSKSIIFRGRELPFLRYPYWEIVCEQ